VFCKAVNRILCMLLYFLFLHPELHAEDTIHDMILSASGVNENDISSAAVKSTISLYDAFALSVRYTEKLMIAGENVAQARSQHSQSIGAYLPNISINAEKSYVDKNTGSGSQKGNASAYIYGRQPIITGLNEWTGINQSKSAASISSHNLALSVQQQLLTISQKYYLVCQLQSLLDTNHEIVDLYKKVRVELLRRVAVGKSRKNELLRTDGQISRLEAQVASVSSQLETAKSELALSIGISSAVSVSGGINLPSPNYKTEDIPSIISRRLEVVIAKENIDIANTNLDAALGGHLPEVYLEGKYRLYSEGNDPTDKYNVAIAASIPIFQGGITSEKVSQAQSMKRQANLVLTQTTRAVEEDIIASYDTWNGFMKQSNAYKNALDSAEQNYTITMNDYRLNLVTILDVISVLTELQQARNDFKTAILALELSRIKLGVAINEFPGSGNLVLKNSSLPEKESIR
jgi:outer membrane protein